MISASVKTRFDWTRDVDEVFAASGFSAGAVGVAVGDSAAWSKSGVAIDATLEGAETVTQVGRIPSSITDTAEILADGASIRGASIRGASIRGASIRGASIRGEVSRRPHIEAGMRVGKYEVREVLGQGGQARAFRAWDPDLERDVVLKVFHASSADAIEEVLKEGRALAKVKSSFVAQCYGAEHFDGLPYLVLEYVPGRTLVELQKEGGLKIRRVLELVAQVCEGLAAVHACGLLHRDVKPSNILVGEDGIPRLVDFGLAEPVAGERSRAISGTLAYMAPEQARGEIDRVGPASDVFGLGAVLYELLTGRPPFTGETETAMLERAREGRVAPVDEVREGLPHSLSELCMRCLAEDAEDRFATAKELREALEESLQTSKRRWRGLSFGFRFGKRQFRFQLATFASMVLVVAMLSRTGMIAPTTNEPVRSPGDDLSLAESPLAESPIAESPIAENASRAMAGSQPIKVLKAKAAPVAFRFGEVDAVPVMAGEAVSRRSAVSAQVNSLGVFSRGEVGLRLSEKSKKLVEALAKEYHELRENFDVAGE